MTTEQQVRGVADLLRTMQAGYKTLSRSHLEQAKAAEDPYLMGKGVAFSEAADAIGAMILTLETEPRPRVKLEVVS